jgi:hypothetical protein
MISARLMDAGLLKAGLPSDPKIRTAYGFASKVKREYRFGFAAGCEAEALPCRSRAYLKWAVPPVWALPAHTADSVSSNRLRGSVYSASEQREGPARTKGRAQLKE